jgi:hypothetical protein
MPRPWLEFHWEVPNYFDVDNRGIAFSTFFAPPAKLGSGSFYFGTFRDGGGAALRGENTYRLRVPANVPVRQFWSVTVYSGETFALFRDATRLTVNSFDDGLRKNSDGSVDIYFGPKAPQGQEANWLYTLPGKTWFPWFRAYDPEKALYDKVWKLPEIELIK